MPPLRMFGHYVPGKTVLLLIGDVGVLVASLFLGDWIRWFNVSGFWIGYPPLLPKATVFLSVALITFSVAGLYDQNQFPRLSQITLRVGAAAVVWGILYAAIAFCIPSLRLSRLASAAGIGLGALGVLAVRRFLVINPAVGRFRDRLLFLGATPMAEQVISAIEEKNPGYEILGYLDDRPAQQVALTNGFRILGTSLQLQEVAAATGAGTIVVSLAERRGTFPLQAILDCKLRGIRVEDWPTFYEKLTGKIIVQNLRPSWLIFSEGFDHRRITRTIKRWMDIVLSAGTLASGWPIFLFVACAIKLHSRGPILFRQERIGERGKPFTLFKFRTMIDGAEAGTGPVWATEQDPRITRVGRWLRKTRLDEFPQIINVLRGEMSFVGPRPERAHFVAQLQEQIPYYAQRHTVKPGITGWAQIRYQYGATVQDAEEKLQYDLYYIKNLSLFLDVVILMSSVQVVLFGKGAR